MKPLAASEVKPRRRFRWVKRIVLSVGLLLLIKIIIGLSMRQYYMYEAAKRLAAAEAEADRDDPHWRWDDLLAHREVVPDEENAAPHVLAAAALLPDPHEWPKRKEPPPPKFEEPDSRELNKVLREGPVVKAEQPRRGWRRADSQWLPDLLIKYPPELLLDEELAAELREELDEVKSAVLKAREVASLGKGRYPIELKRNPLFTPLRHLDQARTVCYLLTADAMRLAHEGNVDGALRSCQAALNVGRSIGDEPFFISVLVRMACREYVFQKLVRILAQGEASDTALADLQHLLEDEARPALLLIGARGERAVSYVLWERVASGELGLELADERPEPTPWYVRPYRWAYLRPVLEYNRAVSLEWMNRAVEIVKKPRADQKEALERFNRDLRKTIRDRPRLCASLLIVPAVDKVAVANHRSRAALNCAQLALAIERYRLWQGHWPRTLDQLTPRFLAGIPDDPFGDGPVRYRRLEDGVAVYSVGQNERDDEGEFDLAKAFGGADIGFRLWDPEWRRQPPAGRVP